MSVKMPPIEEHMQHMLLRGHVMMAQTVLKASFLLFSLARRAISSGAALVLRLS